MAALGIKDREISRARNESLLALIIACEALCISNSTDIKKQKDANKKSDSLKEFNQLLFIIEIIQLIQNNSIFENLQKYLMEMRVEEIVMLENQLLLKLKEYETANNIRMYNDVLKTLQKLMLNESDKLLNQLKDLKSNLGAKLQESNKRILDLTNKINDLNERIESTFRAAILKFAESNPIRIEIGNGIAYLEMDQFLNNISNNMPQRIIDDDFTETEVDEYFYMAARRDVLFAINNSPESQNLSEVAIEDAVHEATQKVTDLIKSDSSFNSFYEIIRQRQQNVSDRSAEIESRDKIVGSYQNIIETIDNVEDSQRIARIGVDNKVMSGEIDSFALAIREARLALNVGSIINLELDIIRMGQPAEGVAVEPIKAAGFDMGAEEDFGDQDDFQAQDNPIPPISIAAAPVFDMGDKEDFAVPAEPGANFEIEEKPLFAIDQEEDFSPNPIQPQSAAPQPDSQASPPGGAPLPSYDDKEPHSDQKLNSEIKQQAEPENPEPAKEKKSSYGSILKGLNIGQGLSKSDLKIDAEEKVNDLSKREQPSEENKYIKGMPIDDKKVEQDSPSPRRSNR